jgi:hypothetical protein
LTVCGERSPISDTGCHLVDDDLAGELTICRSRLGG